MMENTNQTEYLVIAAYLLFMIVTGVTFRRYISNFSDFFRSGCRGTWWLVGGSIFMASFSAWTFTGAAGVAYTSGISVAVIFLANALGYFLNWALTAPLFRQMRATTFPEVITQRFDAATQQFYIWIGVVPGILMAGLTLLGVAVFTSAVFGFNIQFLIIFLGIIVIFYSVIAGSWSVMATDFLQALILMPLAVLITYLSLKSIGGPSAMFQEIRAQGLPDLLRFVDHRPGSQFTLGYALAMFAFVLVSYNSIGSAAKYFACKDGREARKAAALAGVLMLLGAVLWFIPPIVARLQFSSLVEIQKIPVPSDAAYAVIAMKLLPAGLSGLIVVAMFAATITSLDTQINQFAAIITQDVYQPLRKKASEKEILWVGQIASLLTGALIIGTALFLSKQDGKGLFDYMMQFGSLFGTPMVIPMFLAFFIRKVPRWSAIASICGSSVVSFFAWKNAWSYEKTVFSILAVGSAIFILSKFFWKDSTQKYKEKVHRFYEKMHTPVDFEKEVGSANDSSQLKIVGFVALSIGIFIALLAALPNPLAGRLQILFIAGSIALFALVMLISAHLRDKREKGSSNDKTA
jgi:SSS family transporter